VHSFILSGTSGGLPKKAVVAEPLLKFLLAPPTAVGALSLDYSVTSSHY
jgi:hypothetical protein